MHVLTRHGTHARRTTRCSAQARESPRVTAPALSAGAQVAEGERLIGQENIALDGMRHLYSVDMRFAGQTHILRVALERPEISAAALRALFEAAYFRRFRVELAEIRAQVAIVSPARAHL